MTSKPNIKAYIRKYNSNFLPRIPLKKRIFLKKFMFHLSEYLNGTYSYRNYNSSQILNFDLKYFFGCV